MASPCERDHTHAILRETTSVGTQVTSVNKELEDLRCGSLMFFVLEGAEAGHGTGRWGDRAEVNGEYEPQLAGDSSSDKAGDDGLSGESISPSASYTLSIPATKKRNHPPPVTKCSNTSGWLRL